MRYLCQMRASDVTAGAVLRQARLAAGLTQREVATRAGVQQSVVSAYESGSREPSLATLSSLVEACGVSLELHLGEALPPGARPGAAVGPIGRRLRRRRAAVLAVAARHGMTELRVFGSVARGQDTNSSDLDLLVRVP
jgi:transcriptional regulator with XRE-family HTH domain